MKYYIENVDEPTDARDFPGVNKKLFDSDIAALACSAAEYGWAKHGLWELSSWPYTVVVLDEDGSEICRRSVRMEMMPEFWSEA